MDARRLIPIGAVVTALLVIAGIAAHGRPLTAGRGAGPSASFFDYVATTLLIIGALTVVVVVWAMKTTPAPRGRPRRSRWHILSQLALIGGAILLAEWMLHSKFQQRLRNLHLGQSAGQPHAPTAKNGPPAGHLRNAHLRWDEIAIVLAVIAAVGLYVWFTRPARKPLRALTRRRTVLSVALDESLDDLRSDPDIRRAIIAAYARMEHALGAAGIRRRASEAPFEYLARSLVELDASTEAAQRLTDLFERAKFSHHVLAEPMRDEAIDALVAVRDDLNRPAGEPVTA